MERVIQGVNEAVAKEQAEPVLNPYDKAQEPWKWLEQEVHMLAEVADFHKQDAAAHRKPLASMHWGGRAEAFRHVQILLERMKRHA